MVMNPPLGALVTGTVVAQNPWGIDLLLDEPWAGFTGTVDLAFVTDERPFNAPDDFPSIGAVLEAVVVAYTPTGAIRLSTRDSDIDPRRSDE